MIYGKGYIGDGDYKPKENGKNTNVYNIWHNILERCFSKKFKDNNPTYMHCSVCDEWLCFQNFASWYFDNIYYIENEKMCVDKDVLTKHNKLYSPDTCCIIPNHINMLLTKVDKKRGKYPIGVSFNKNTGRYLAKYKRNGKTVFIGEYDDPVAAFYEYKKHKENEIKRVANMYARYIPQNVYDALINYSVEIDD